ncbi:antibiotic biosynthesis monooxygenase [Alkalihalophilus sp. As8PL]|uniref:Antibiotic biosynthesis monooxygenase n=1 Tax=Alkalihalophilus sp. As8PL TaxID=3237103 RepID=A0AB39BXC3_9BACI
MDALIFRKQPTDTAAYVHLAHEEAPLYYVERPTESQEGDMYTFLSAKGQLPPQGFVVMNNIPVTETGRAAFEERFNNRAGLVEEEPGFKAIRILRPESTDTYIVMTIWDNHESFTKWQESNAYKHAHKKRGTKEGLNTSIFPRPSFVTTYTIN